MTARTLLTRTTVALLLGALAVVACYCFVDRPVASFAHNHRVVPRELLEWPQVLSD